MSVFKPPKISNFFAGTSIGGSVDDDIINFLTGNNSESYVSMTEAVKNSDIFSIIMLLSGDLANANLVAEDSMVQDIFKNPDGRTNAHSFWQSIYAQLLLNGETFVYRWRNRNGKDIRLEPLRPSQVGVYLTQDGQNIFYQVSFDEPNLGVQTFASPDILHFRLMSTNGGLTGISPLGALTNELNVKKASDELTMTALKQSISASGVLTIKNGGLLDWSQKAARSRKFMQQYGSSNGGPIVLDDLEEYKPLELKNNVAQLLNQVNWTSTQIAKIYNVPDSYLNGQGDQQSSLEQIKGLYANALNRHIQYVVSELATKFSTNVYADVRPAIDPFGDSYMTRLSTLVKDGSLGSNQFDWLARQKGYIPEDAPRGIFKDIVVKGGEKNK